MLERMIDNDAQCDIHRLKNYLLDKTQSIDVEHDAELLQTLKDQITKSNHFLKLTYPDLATFNQVTEAWDARVRLFYQFLAEIERHQERRTNSNKQTTIGTFSLLPIRTSYNIGYIHLDSYMLMNRPNFRMDYNLNLNYK